MDDDDNLDPNLSRRLDIEMRREMAAAERDAAVLAAKQRTLADVAREAVSRGDTLTLAIGDLEVTGIGTYARGDLLTMRTRLVSAEVNLAAIDWLRIDHRSQAGGQTSPVEAESFLARLGLLEITGEHIELIGRGGVPRIHGSIGAVARDHVMVVGDNDRSWLFPITAVAAVFRQLPE